MLKFIDVMLGVLKFIRIAAYTACFAGVGILIWTSNFIGARIALTGLVTIIACWFLSEALEGERYGFK